MHIKMTAKSTMWQLIPFSALSCQGSKVTHLANNLEFYTINQARHFCAILWALPVGFLAQADFQAVQNCN